MEKLWSPELSALDARTRTIFDAVKRAGARKTRTKGVNMSYWSNEGTRVKGSNFVGAGTRKHGYHPAYCTVYIRFKNPDATPIDALNAALKYYRGGAFGATLALDPGSTYEVKNLTRWNDFPYPTEYLVRFWASETYGLLTD